MAKANCKYIIVTLSADGSKLVLSNRNLSIEAGTVVIWLLDSSVSGSFGANPISGQLSDTMSADAFSRPDVAANGRAVAIRLLANPPIEAVYQLTATIAGLPVSSEYGFPEATTAGAVADANVQPPSATSPKIKTG